MNYYPFHVGDYWSHTTFLTPMQDLAYRRLLDLYYTREQALPSDPLRCARLANLSAYLEDVQVVLEEFFVLEEDGYRNKRCDEILEKFISQREKAQRAGIESGKARRAMAERREEGRRAGVEPSMNPATTTDQPSVNECSADIERPLNERSTNVEPTNNQEPITNNQRKPLTPLAPSAFTHSPPKAAEAVDKVVLVVENPDPPESAGGTSPPDTGQAGKEPVIAIPLNNGKEFGIDQAQIEAWQCSYPAVDVPQQLRNMREWCLSNPTKRKTPRGVRTFITGWLAREQDRSRAGASVPRHFASMPRKPPREAFTKPGYSYGGSGKIAELEVEA